MRSLNLNTLTQHVKPLPLRASVITRFNTRDQEPDNGRPLHLVRDIMTEKPITVHPDESINAALEKLVKNKIRGLPVVDSNGRCVGMVSDWDLINLSDLSGELAAHHFPAPGQEWSAWKQIQSRLEKNKGHSVKCIMDTELTTVSQDSKLDLAARLLLDNKRRRLPVVDESGRLVGVISRGDVLAAALVLKKRSKAGAGPSI